MDAKQEVLAAWKAIRSGHREAVKRIVEDVRTGSLPAGIASIDIQGITEQSLVGSRPESLYRHYMISEETYQLLRGLEV